MGAQAGPQAPGLTPSPCGECSAGAALEASALGVSGAPRLWVRPPGTREKPLSTTPPNTDRATGMPGAGGACTLPTSRPQPCSRTPPKPQARTDPEAGSGAAGPRATPKPGVAATPLLGLSPPEREGVSCPYPSLSLIQQTSLNQHCASRSQEELAVSVPSRRRRAREPQGPGEGPPAHQSRQGRLRQAGPRDPGACRAPHPGATRRNTATKLLPRSGAGNSRDGSQHPGPHPCHLLPAPLGP